MFRFWIDFFLPEDAQKLFKKNVNFKNKNELYQKFPNVMYLNGENKQMAHNFILHANFFFF